MDPPTASTVRALVASLCVAGLLGPVLAARGADERPPAVTETVQVTATREPEPVDPEPAAITIVSGAELRQTGARDLATALALVAGLSVSAGGDGGPAGSVPELWGLREFDAFLLVVDDVPWGGAFNPALASLDLNGVERIEILRGAAPVMYGATSFIGVIHVLHHRAGEGEPGLGLASGNHSTGGASVYLPLDGADGYRQSFGANVDRVGLADDDAGFDRAHVLYRGLARAAGGSVRIDFDGTLLRQDPASPRPREGAMLSPLVPVDTNNNPEDAKLDEDRIQLVGGYEREVGGGEWSTTLAITRVERDIVRGFLSDLSEAADPNAAGFSQEQDETGLYVDSHFGFKPCAATRIVAGLDWLHGKGESEGRNFAYHVNLDGSDAPSSSNQTIEERVDLEDERDFSGLYAQVEWTPGERWLFQAGARLNHTEEERRAQVEPGSAGGEEGEQGGGEDSASETRASGTAGASFRVWRIDADSLWIFADYRAAFKPAAIDFGPEGEPTLLEPETGRSWELGLKGHHLGGHLDWLASAFRMDLEDLVTSTVVDGLPALVNSGKQRLEGVEVELGHLVRSDLRWQIAYSHHDAEFRDFVQSFDGVPTQLAGNRLEMSAEDLTGLGFVYFPHHGFIGSVLVNYVGDRFLNKRNTAPADDYTTWSAGLGFRSDGWQVRLDGYNLNDTRPPVAESELGDAQYYILPSRSVILHLDLTWGG